MRRKEKKREKKSSSRFRKSQRDNNRINSIFLRLIKAKMT